MLYTYQTKTLKPVCMADPTVSSMELIVAAQSVPHVGGDPVQAQALCEIQYDKSHGSLAERGQLETRSNLTTCVHKAHVHTSKRSSHNIVLHL